MVAAELKIRVKKLKPHVVTYRDYKHFDDEMFWSDIQSSFSEDKIEMF